MSVPIRPERPADLDAIRHVNRLAFGQDVEASLVDGQVVGYILFSDLPILTGAATVPALALAPMAVLPAFQNQGIGSALVRRGLEVCRDQGHRIVVVLGHPHFYPRFGFSPELAAALASPFSGNDAFMAVELVPGALDGVQGQVQYAPPFEGLTGAEGTTAERSKAPRQRTLRLVDGTFAVCRLDSKDSIPPWATAGPYFSITRTADELSVVTRQDAVPEGIRCERGWRCLRVAGTIPFSEVGVLSSLAAPLAEAGVTLFAVSTFDTDYLLVKEEDLTAALGALRRQGYSVG
jgi:putative acetyltransferase